MSVPGISSAACRVVLTMAISTMATTSTAERVMPLEATALVRLIGHVRVLRGEDERAWRERLVDLQEVDVGIGSGFIISPEGWVVTNHHVVASERSVVLVRGQKLEVSVEVTAIEVVLPADGRQPIRRYSATIYAVDAELDLALLRINGTDLPYVALGDSDAIATGESVSATGYPFGGMVEIDKPKDADSIPTPSVTTGAVSALRLDATGERRYMQVSAALNPGNSGGPIADGEGYVVGVAQARLKNADGIGFAIPINRVKRLLLTHGLDAVLPATMLAPGGHIASPRKGLSLPVPLGFDDRSPVRLRLEGASDSRTSRVVDSSSEHLELRVDRIATPQTLEQIERGLLMDGTLERFQSSRNPVRWRGPNAVARRALA